MNGFLLDLEAEWGSRGAALQRQLQWWWGRAELGVSGCLSSISVPRYTFCFLGFGSCLGDNAAVSCSCRVCFCHCLVGQKEVEGNDAQKWWGSGVEQDEPWS